MDGSGQVKRITLWRLSEANAERMASGNELGMGYQFVQEQDASDPMYYFVLAGRYAVQADAIATSGEIVFVAEDELERLPVLERDLALSANVQAFARFAGLDATRPHVEARFRKMHGSPPFSGTTSSVMTFVRYSAFANDPRVSANGNLTPGTYATSPADAHEVPSGLAAVGRYALPNPRPAIHRFDITVPAGTPYLYGSVVPAFGRSGGGVEIEFPNGVPNAISLLTNVIMEL